MDDRSLNGYVWQQFTARLARLDAPRLLEVGGGIGSMFARLVERGALTQGAYTLVDASSEVIAHLPTYLSAWARQNGLSWQPQGKDRYTVGASLTLRPVCEDIFRFLNDQPGAWDGVLAHAVLDLLPLEALLTRLMAALRPGGLLYLSLNYDGLTAFEPSCDPEFEHQILALYDQSMEARRWQGQPTGGSRCGRRLLRLLPASGAQLLAAGASDWVLHPGASGYTQKTAALLSTLLNFIATELDAHPRLDTARLERWLQARRKQLAAGQLCAVVHHLDILAQRPAV